MKLFALPLVAAVTALVCLTPAAQSQEAKNAVTRVPVVFSAGHDTDPRDGGRPVVLIASALGVSSEVFRDAFSHVHPARAGAEPEPQQVRANKDALLSALGKYGVTNERLDTVSNYYRYVGSRGELWPTRAAVANALVRDGVITGYEIVKAGSGYTTPPTITVPNFPSAKPTVKLQFTKHSTTNGSVASITVR